METYKKIFIHGGPITRRFRTVETLFYRWGHWKHFKKNLHFLQRWITQLFKII